MADISLTLLGLRRVGVSLGLALKRYESAGRGSHRFSITGCDKEHSAGKEAQRLGAIDRVERNLEAACSAADIVVIDAGLAQLKEYLEAVGPALKSGCVVFELAGLKLPPIQWAERYLPESAYLVGLAPVLNPKTLYTVAADDDLEHASADLFDNGNLFITPSTHCPAEAVQLATDLVKLLGLEPHFVEPAEHDGLIAAVGLLPALLSMAAFNVASSAPSWKDIRLLTNPPFALSTAALLSDAGDLLNALSLNRDNVVHYLDQAIGQLQGLRAALAQADDVSLGSALADTATQHMKWQAQRESGNWQERRTIETPSIRTSLLQSLLGGLVTRGRKEEEEDDGGKRK